MYLSGDAQWLKPVGYFYKKLKPSEKGKEEENKKSAKELRYSHGIVGSTLSQWPN